MNSITQIASHTSKSEASIQSVTALNIGETENSLTDQLEASQQGEHKDMPYLWILEHVRDENFSIKKEKNCVNIGTEPIFTSVLLLQCCKLQVWYSNTPLQDDEDESKMV